MLPLHHHLQQPRPITSVFLIHPHPNMSPGWFLQRDLGLVLSLLICQAPPPPIDPVPSCVWGDSQPGAGPNLHSLLEFLSESSSGILHLPQALQQDSVVSLVNVG